MENASKVLLIAGTILIAITVIAIAVAVTSAGREGLNEVGDIAIDNVQITSQRNKFIKYQGEVTGAQVKQCISAAIAHNSNLKAGEGDLAVSIKVKLTPTAAAYTDMVIRGDFNNNGGKQGAVGGISNSIDNTSMYTTAITYLPGVGSISQIDFTIK